MRDTALGADTQMPGIKFYILHIQIDEFLQSDAGTEEQLDDDSISSCSHRGLAAEFLEQVLFLSLRQEPWRCAGKPAHGQ